jgi:hypothetical protein
MGKNYGRGCCEKYAAQQLNCGYTVIKAYNSIGLEKGRFFFRATIFDLGVKTRYTDWTKYEH